jgi:hypothetical protein
MAIQGFMESSLATSEIFQGLRQSSENDPTKQATTLIKTAKHLTNEDIEPAYIAVRQITDSLTRAAMKAFDEGRTVLVYNNVPALSLSQSLPFMTFKLGNDYKTYVFVDKYITVSRDGVLSIQAPILRDLLTGAVISNGLKRNYSAMASSQYLARTLTEIYNKLFVRIINREYSIAAQKDTIEPVQYWINRFFLESVFGSTDTPENIDTLSRSTLRFSDEMAVSEMKRKFDEAHPTRLSDLLELLKTASPRMKSLNLGVFLSDWIKYYYVPSMMAADTIEYLLFMIVTLLSGNNIINISAADIVKEAKNIKQFRSEMLKLV